jgi:hypothetical protein
MFQFFLGARTNNYFKARSAGRDTEADRARVTSIFRSIEDALEGAKAEQAGLKSRIDDARSGGQSLSEFARHRDSRRAEAIERVRCDHQARSVLEDRACYKVSRL